MAAREGKISPQTQSSVAITGDDKHWFLINASPDLAQQIENTPALQPRRDRLRDSPITGVLLTNGDLDHALGLVLMRQLSERLAVYATAETQAVLGWLDVVLKPFCGVEWRTVSLEWESLGQGLVYRAIKLQNSIAFQIRDESSKASALIAPAAGELADELCAAVNGSDLVLFDGTFWQDDELRDVRPEARSARKMNHLPISDGSLNFLRDSTARRKIYTHINNTNPILMPGSAEQRQVEQAGIEIAHDGLEIVL